MDTVKINYEKPLVELLKEWGYTILDFKKFESYMRYEPGDEVIEIEFYRVYSPELYPTEVVDKILDTGYRPVEPIELLGWAVQHPNKVNTTCVAFGQMWTRPIDSCIHWPQIEISDTVSEWTGRDFQLQFDCCNSRGNFTKKKILMVKR